MSAPAIGHRHGSTPKNDLASPQRWANSLSARWSSNWINWGGSTRERSTFHGKCQQKWMMTFGVPPWLFGKHLKSRNDVQGIVSSQGMLEVFWSEAMIKILKQRSEIWRNMLDIVHTYLPPFRWKYVKIVFECPSIPFSGWISCIYIYNICAYWFAYI